MSAEELVDIVDEHDQVVKVVTRREMREGHLPHRASYIVVIDKAGRVLVELRTLCKDYEPGKLDACVGGVVQAGEDPVYSAERELAEEVGIEVTSCQDAPSTASSATPSIASSSTPSAAMSAAAPTAVSGTADATDSATVATSGTSAVAFHHLGKMTLPYRSGRGFLIAYLFIAQVDVITVRQKSEVSGILYLSPEELLRLQDNCTYDSIISYKEIVKRAREQGIIA